MQYHIHINVPCADLEGWGRGSNPPEPPPQEKSNLLYLHSKITKNNTPWTLTPGKHKYPSEDNPLSEIILDLRMCTDIYKS